MSDKDEKKNGADSAESGGPQQPGSGGGYDEKA
jgi:hypothetical protein